MTVVFLIAVSFVYKAGKSREKVRRRGAGHGQTMSLWTSEPDFHSPREQRTEAPAGTVANHANV